MVNNALQNPNEFLFIYIASLRRTGSTVLSEALSLFPHSFIFQEPHLGNNLFSFTQSDFEFFLNYGIDLKAFWKRHRYIAYINRRLCLEKGYMIKIFKKKLIPQLRAHIAQIGVKEIRHDNWRLYFDYFPKMRILLTGRDPRDIYISLFNRIKSGKADWSGEYSPKLVATDLNKQFKKQIDMFESTDCLKIRYEDFCINPISSFKKIKYYVKSPIPKIGTIGRYLANNPGRVNEYELHGNYITKKRVFRWKLESDQNLVSEAQDVFNLMPDYCEFWGYM